MQRQASLQGTALNERLLNCVSLHLTAALFIPVIYEFSAETFTVLFLFLFLCGNFHERG